MSKSIWSILGIVLAFFIIQSCGEGFIMGPVGAPTNFISQAGGGGAPSASGGGGGGGGGDMTAPNGGGTGMQVLGGFEADGGWPDYDYDDGGTFWDGGTPIVLMDWHWNQGLSQYRGNYGQRYQANCVPMGSEFAVWGSNPYTDDSPVCTAGAHLGLIARDVGGWVTVELRPAQRGFQGSTQNGVTGLPWGPYPGSYRFIDPQPQHP